MSNNQKDIVDVLFEWIVDGFLWLVGVSIKVFIVGFKLLWAGLCALAKWIMRFFKKPSPPVDVEEIMD